MIKLSKLIHQISILLESEEKELPKEFKVSERGFNFLKQRVDDLNKKAIKYKVPPIEIKIVKEDMVKSIRPEIKKMQLSQPVISPLSKDVVDNPDSWIMVKEYTISLKNDPPHIDGYEFIARLEHTDVGNFIYTNPKASIKNLPPEFKSMNQHCDICHTNRDRNDTFVLKLEKDDPDRFPDKKAGDLIIVGRNCLSRFLPGMSIDGLITWTKMMQDMEYDIQNAQKMEEFDDNESDELRKSGGGSGTYYEPNVKLAKWISAVYLYTGYYLSKKRAEANAESNDNTGTRLSTISTLSRALSEMDPDFNAVQNPRSEYPVYYKIKEDKSFNDQSEKLMSEFIEWSKKQDWDTKAKNNPQYSDFYNNLKLVSQEDYIKEKHFGFFSALFQLFIMDKKELEKKSKIEKESSELSYFGNPGEKITLNVKVNKIKSYEGPYGISYIITMTGLQTSKDPSTGQDLVKKGNLIYFSSTFNELQEGEEATIKATVKAHQPNKFTQIPETVITRVKVINFITYPDKNKK